MADVTYASVGDSLITTIATSAGALITCGSSETIYIRTIIIHNGNTTTEVVRLYTVPNSGGSLGTAAVTNLWLKEEMAAGKTRIIELAVPGIMLTSENDSIQGVTDTASKVTFQAYGGTE
jgi:hypothetical protein